ncbi:MAG TPA: hypothetical protein VHW23_35135 [Kofleriaceae bacterium]|nr:hypothetical protein [Kofleriaceae bacterium]
MIRAVGGALGLVICVALAAAGVAVVACAGGPPGAKSSAPAEQPAAAMPAAPGDPRAEIDALDRDIAADLARAHIAPPPDTCSGSACAVAMSEPFITPTSSDPACHPASSDRCGDVCTLSSSICRNQERICELARRLPGDDRAAGTCTRARASCQAAHDSCCRCVL